MLGKEEKNSKRGKLKSRKITIKYKADFYKE